MDQPAPLPPDAEKELIRRAQSGDEAAFGELVNAHYAYVYRLILGIVRHEHDARDIGQEVWLTVWRKLATFHGEARLTTWLHPIATRRALDHLRKRRRWYDRFLPFSLDHGSAPGAEPATEDDRGPDSGSAGRREQLDLALAALPPLHRTVLALREVQGLSYAEIATAVGIPAGTVMSRLYHARRLLAKKLKDQT